MWASLSGCTAGVGKRRIHFPVFAGSEAQRVVLEAGVHAVASVPVVGTGGDARAAISVHGRRGAVWTADQQQMEAVA